MTTLFLNVGRKHLVTPAEIAALVATATQLPPDAIGTIVVRQKHSFVDVVTGEVERILARLTGEKIKGIALAPALAVPNAISPRLAFPRPPCFNRGRP